MLIKKKTSPKPVCAENNKGNAQSLCCTDRGDLRVHQANPLDLSRVERHLRSYRIDPDGTVVVRVIDPIDVNMPTVEVEGSVNVENTVTVKPVTVANMPDHIRIQEDLHVVQTPIEAQVVPISFEGNGAVVIPHHCRIYSIYLTVYDVTWIELSGITGEMYTGEFKLDLFPLFIQLDKLEIKVREWSRVGGYVVYES